MIPRGALVFVTSAVVKEPDRLHGTESSGFSRFIGFIGFIGVSRVL